MYIPLNVIYFTTKNETRYDSVYNSSPLVQTFAFVSLLYVRKPGYPSKSTLRPGDTMDTCSFNWLN